MARNYGTGKAIRTPSSKNRSTTAMSGDDEGSVTVSHNACTGPIDATQAGALRNSPMTLPSIQSSGENKMHARWVRRPRINAGKAGTSQPG